MHSVADGVVEAAARHDDLPGVVADGGIGEARVLQGAAEAGVAGPGIGVAAGLAGAGREVHAGAGSWGSTCDGTRAHFDQHRFMGIADQGAGIVIGPEMHDVPAKAGWGPAKSPARWHSTRSSQIVGDGRHADLAEGRARQAQVPGEHDVLAGVGIGADHVKAHAAAATDADGIADCRGIGAEVGEWLQGRDLVARAIDYRDHDVALHAADPLSIAVFIDRHADGADDVGIGGGEQGGHARGGIHGDRVVGTQRAGR